MERPAIEVQHVGKKYCRDLRTSLRYGLFDIVRACLGRSKNRETLRAKEFWALEELSFCVSPGQAIALIGRNGSGKSTLIKLLTGLIKPDRGIIQLRGEVRSLVELGAGFHLLLTGNENLVVNALLHGFSAREVERLAPKIIEFSELAEFMDTPIQSYSSGMRSRLGFSVAAHLNPDILLIDEALAVGDSAFREKCYERILELKAKGCAVVVVSHDAQELLRVCDQGLVLDHGKVRFFGPVTEALACYNEVLNLSGRVGLSGEQQLHQRKVS